MRTNQQRLAPASVLRCAIVHSIQPTGESWIAAYAGISILGFDWPTVHARFRVWNPQAAVLSIVGHLSVHNCSLAGNRFGTGICRSFAADTSETAPVLVLYSE